jgi:hypothetical protein
MIARSSATLSAFGIWQVARPVLIAESMYFVQAAHTNIPLVRTRSPYGAPDTKKARSGRETASRL